MSRGLIITLVVVAVLAFWGIGTRNGLATSQLDVETAWAKVQTQYQRRMDLIGNLVETVKGVAKFEKETLTQVIEARANATSIKLTADQLTPENIQKFQAAQSQLNGTLSRLMAVAESYPQLKATANFSELQAEIAGTENRVAVSRDDFNNVIRTYNGKVVTFPASLIAGMMGFTKKAPFEADAAAQKAPKVQF